MAVGVFLLSLAALVCVFPLSARAGELPALKVLSTPSCPACAQMHRIMDDLNSTYGSKIATEKINLFEHRDIAKQYNVKYVPHLLFVDEEGKVFKEKIGVIPLGEVLQTFKEGGIDMG
jgi:thiol-disulfide isomerase/thioredoxin